MATDVHRADCFPVVYDLVLVDTSAMQHLTTRLTFHDVGTHSIDTEAAM